jgi:NADPH:quinone reductase-like Zn-dependent oxidoreductase
VAEPGRLYVWSYREQPLTDGAFRVRTLYSGLSAGTELSFVKGTNPYLRARWDTELGAFRGGEPSARYPVPFLGYMEVGRVTSSQADAVAEGDLVSMAYGHKTGHTAEVGEFFVRLPADLDPLLGIYVAQMGPVCANGLLHAAAEAQGETPGAVLADGVRGRRVFVSGAGVVGLLTALWAKHLGAAEVAVADATSTRLTAAEHLGLLAIDDSDGNGWMRVKQRWRNGNEAGCDVAFQCRGQTHSLVTALRALRPQGTVIDLAFYQGGATELRLGDEFHHNGLTIRSAQISRVPRSLRAKWDRARLAAETISFLRGCGSVIRAHLVTDVVDFEEAVTFVAAIAARRRQTLQAVFKVAP